MVKNVIILILALTVAAPKIHSSAKGNGGTQTGQQILINPYVSHANSVPCTPTTQTAR
jgi:hypothetical protein